MSLITSNPLQEFYDSLGKSPVKQLQVASPYITKPGARMLIEEFGRKRTKFQVLTNLSDFNVALSLSNPIAPILELMKKFGDRVEIKSHPMLHAKIYLCEGKAALLGSSNLTLGGMERNAELNWLVRGRKQGERNQLGKLVAWYQERWDEAGKGLSKRQLLDIEKAWEQVQKRLSGIVGSLVPVPRLGGNYWEKVRKITGRKSWKRVEIQTLLSEKEDNSSQNTFQKLVFLENLGLINFDDKTVTSRGVVRSPLEMFRLLDQGHLEVSLKAILKSFPSGKKGYRSYAELSKELGIPNDDILHVPVLWLKSLGYLKRRPGSSPYEYSLTSKVKELDLG